MNFKQNFTFFSVKGRRLGSEYAFEGFLQLCQKHEFTVILTIGLSQIIVLTHQLVLHYFSCMVLQLWCRGFTSVLVEVWFLGRLVTGQDERWSSGFFSQVPHHSSESQMVEIQGDRVLRNSGSLKVSPSESMFGFTCFSWCIRF